MVKYHWCQGYKGYDQIYLITFYNLDASGIDTGYAKRHGRIITFALAKDDP